MPSFTNGLDHQPQARCGNMPKYTFERLGGTEPPARPQNRLLAFLWRPATPLACIIAGIITGIGVFLIIVL